jgi:hypothetical protein
MLAALDAQPGPQRIVALLHARELIEPALVECPHTHLDDLLRVVLAGAEMTPRMVQLAAVFPAIGALLDALGAAQPVEPKGRRGQAARGAALRNPVQHLPWPRPITTWPTCGAKRRGGRGICRVRVPPPPFGNGRCKVHGMHAGRGKVRKLKSGKSGAVARRLQLEADLQLKAAQQTQNGPVTQTPTE